MKIDDLHNILKNKRELWKQINPKGDFPGVVVMQVDHRVTALVVKSVFQTAAFAGYPNVSLHGRADPQGQERRRWRALSSSCALGCPLVPSTPLHEVARRAPEARSAGRFGRASAPVMASQNPPPASGSGFHYPRRLGDHLLESRRRESLSPGATAAVSAAGRRLPSSPHASPPCATRSKPGPSKLPETTPVTSSRPRPCPQTFARSRVSTCVSTSRTRRGSDAIRRAALDSLRDGFTSCFTTHKNQDPFAGPPAS